VLFFGMMSVLFWVCFLIFGDNEYNHCSICTANKSMINPIYISIATFFIYQKRKKVPEKSVNAKCLVCVKGEASVVFNNSIRESATIFLFTLLLKRLFFICVIVLV
jgi:hypothetical protein